MKFLEEEMSKAEDGLKCKIEQFFEEHPAAVCIKDSVEESNYGDDGKRYDDSKLYRFLNKEGKETNYYLYDDQVRYNLYCGCRKGTDSMLVFEKDDPEEAKKYHRYSLMKVNKLFEISRGFSYPARWCKILQDPNYPPDLGGHLCGKKADYNMIVNLLDKIRQKIQKKEE